MNYTTLISAINAGRMASKAVQQRPSKTHYEKVDKALQMLGRNRKNFPIVGIELKAVDMNILIAQQNKHMETLRYWEKYKSNNFDFWGAIMFFHEIKREI